MVKYTATTLCIFGYLLTLASAQQFPYPPQSPAKPNPWGLQLRKLPAAKPPTQKLPTKGSTEKYVPPTPPPKYLPSQLNPNAGAAKPNYAAPDYKNPSVAAPSYSDIWSTWKNNGGAFRYSSSADFSASYGDVVVAVNSMGSLKAKTVGPSGTSSWVTLATSIAGDIIESRPAVVVNAGVFQVFVVTALGNVFSLTTPAPLPLSQLTSPLAWKAQLNDAETFINNPAAVYLGSNYFVFAIDRADRQIYYGVDAAGTLDTSLDPTKTFIFSPTAATYTTNGISRVVVAAVTFDGTLNVYQSTAATATTLTAATFEATDVVCIDSPQAIGLGDSVEIYCRGRDMQFYCVTVTQGSVADSRVLPEADIPDTFDAVYNPINYLVSIYSKTPAGRVVSKGFQTHKPINYW